MMVRLDDGDVGWPTRATMDTEDEILCQKLQLTEGS